MRRARVREHVAGAGARLVQDDLRRQPARVVRGDRRHHRRILRGRARAALTARRAAPYMVNRRRARPGYAQKGPERLHMPRARSAARLVCGNWRQARLCHGA